MPLAATADDASLNDVLKIREELHLAKLYFRYGAMGSAKTMNLLAVAHNYEQQGKRVFLIKPSVDTRFGESIIRSRTGLCREADLCVNADSILDYSKFEGIHCILVDECQFLSAALVNQLRNVSVDMDIPVICYGLRTNFKSQLFEGSKRLFEVADAIEEVKTTCAFCNRKGVFNIKLVNGRGVVEGEEIELGAEELYLPACCKCYEARVPCGENPLRNPQRQSETAVSPNYVELWMVRHGLTVENKTRLLSGWIQAQLSEEGKEMARSLRPKLEDVHFDGVFSSDLQRTIETARLAYGEPVPDPRLREMCFGDYDGKPIAELDPAWVDALYAFNTDLHTPNGETIEDVKKRVSSFLNELKPGRYLIFSHGGAIRSVTVILGQNRFPTNCQILRVDWTHQRFL